MRARRVKLIFVNGYFDDGALVSELLLAKDYLVHGIKRRSSSFNTDRIEHLYHDPHEEDVWYFMHYGDMTDATDLINTRSTTWRRKATSRSRSKRLSTQPTTMHLATLRLLEAMRILGLDQKTRCYQASRSELYGMAQEVPQSESTPFYPGSPYAAAKLYAYWIIVNYRVAYGMFAANSILFNHEGRLRGETFVTRKITRAVAAVERGLQSVLYLGNLNAQRDWGSARDYVDGMWRILQQPYADNFVLAAGETHSVLEFTEVAFREVGPEVGWEGDGADEVGIDSRSGQVLVRIDPRYFRPTEVDLLIGNPAKAHDKLGWRHHTIFIELVKVMVSHASAEAQEQATGQSGA
jgi:GDPmannose 4,6-dehydratase